MGGRTGGGFLASGFRTPLAAWASKWYPNGYDSPARVNSFRFSFDAYHSPVMNSSAASGMPAELCACWCGGTGGRLMARGCSCGGVVHVDTCLYEEEIRTCICARCGIPLSTEVAEAIYYKIRARCTTVEDHNACDRGALKILAPSLLPRQKANLVKSICLRRLLNNELSFDLGCLFVHVARLELYQGLWSRSIDTCKAIKEIFAQLPPGDYKELVAKTDSVHNLR